MKPGFLTILLMLLLFCGMAAAMEWDMGGMHKLAQQFELQATAEPPAWSIRSDRPLFRVAWLSDLHITDDASLKICRAALEQIGSVLKPDAVFITGDNCGMAADPEKNNDGVARHSFLKSILDECLPEIPVRIIPGDNWPAGFSKVFGSANRSFSIHGFRFITLAPEIQGTREGCLILSDAQWKWFAAQLDAAAGVPTFILTHFPLFPASFIDAPRICRRLAGTSVAGVLSGHLHLDLTGAINGQCTQWMAPAVGRSHRPGFKILSFYRDAVIAAAHEWDAEAGGFVPVNKFLQILLPEKLKITGDGTNLPENAMPPAEIRRDPTLDSREEEVKQSVQRSMIQFGMQRFKRR